MKKCGKSPDVSPAPPHTFPFTQIVLTVGRPASEDQQQLGGTIGVPSCIPRTAHSAAGFMYLMTVMEIGSTDDCTAEGAALPPPPPAARRVTISFVPEGRTEAEQIELWQPLGKGAYGVVYSGSWRRGQVAVKV